MEQYCELCNKPATEDNPVRYFYDLAAIVCKECIEDYFQFAEAEDDEY